MLLFAFAPSGSAAAEAIQVELPPLVFREVKLKGEDFIVLQATTDDVKLDEYWLGYSSSAALDDIDPEYRLAAATLQTGKSVLLVNDEAVPTCDALYTMDMPVDLAETKGTVGLWHREGVTSAQILYDRVDSFSWTTSKTGVADIIRPTTAEDGLEVPTWFRQLDAGNLAWQIGDLRHDDEGLCTLVTTSGAVLGTYTAVAYDVPVVEESEVTYVEPVNVDLAYPLVTELLPNPAGTGNDSTDEFIELYNPNGVAFSLDGFTLQTGTTTLHSYVFPEDAILAPGYHAFYAEETGLSMSNTSGQARLLDPSGQIVAETGVYDGADDGVSWAFVSGAWKWTTTPTPGAANTLTQVVKAAKKTTAKKATTKKATTKKTTTTKAKTASTASASSIASEATKPLRGIHPLVLVGILLAAVGYGLYEHRQDLANAFYQFKNNRTVRRSHRK